MKSCASKSVFMSTPYLEFILKLIVILVLMAPPVSTTNFKFGISLARKKVTITFPGDYEFESAYKNYVRHRNK